MAAASTAEMIVWAKYPNAYVAYDRNNYTWWLRDLESHHVIAAEGTAGAAIARGARFIIEDAATFYQVGAFWPT